MAPLNLILMMNAWLAFGTIPQINFIRFPILKLLTLFHPKWRPNTTNLLPWLYRSRPMQVANTITMTLIQKNINPTLDSDICGIFSYFQTYLTSGKNHKIFSGRCRSISPYHHYLRHISSLSSLLTCIL